MAAFPVLFVCEGNLCRSPFAERMLRLRLAERGADDRFLVTSAGTRSPVGRPIDPRSEAGLLARGTNGDGFASRQLVPSLVARAGVVLAATRALRAQALEEAPAALARSFTVLELAALVPGAPPGLTAPALVADCAQRRSTLGPDAVLDVPDPVREGQDVFDRVAVLLDEACTALAGALAATV